MKHVGKTLKKYIEDNHIKKRNVADAAHITYNYLSTIFTRDSVDCDMLERLCKATGMPTGAFFDDAGGCSNLSMDNGQDASQVSQTISANELAAMRALLDEKERTIQILMAAKGFENGTKMGQGQ